ncbi:Uu.00g117100.m01.CDS01 [Anthostomella pinea]|uniref:Uu.00g117100.m01.CDS01 n=1 Tax=Anthostomella pinea TaxID=933095 RepID=A0AAI8VGV9_9PEZI|nr:Uu.00g117100.m01.CDS01 [Anthostomella pinea]
MGSIDLNDAVVLCIPTRDVGRTKPASSDVSLIVTTVINMSTVGLIGDNAVAAFVKIEDGSTTILPARYCLVREGSKTDKQVRS